jgi:hypothetical protein
MRKLRLLASASPCVTTVSVLLTGLVLLAWQTSAQAAPTPSPITFAQFSEAPSGSNANVFTYIDNGPSGDAEFGTTSNGVFGAPIPATFNFLSVTGTLPADLQNTQNAMVSLTSSTIEPVNTAFSGTLGDQVFDGTEQVDVLTITRDTPAAEGNGSRTNLLTMTFTDDLLGLLGGRTPQLSGNTPEDTVTYTSDFLNFSNATESNYSLTFTSWTTTADGGGLELSPIANDDYYATATAAGTGTFDDMPAPSVPEPTSGILGIVGLTAFLTGRRGRVSR